MKPEIFEHQDCPRYGGEGRLWVYSKGHSKERGPRSAAGKDGI